MAHQITHPTGKPEGLSLAVLRLDAEPVAYLTPVTGQFLSVDPDVAQTEQAYIYAGNDPVNSSDALGQAAECEAYPWAHTDYGQCKGIFVQAPLVSYIQSAASALANVQESPKALAKEFVQASSYIAGWLWDNIYQTATPGDERCVRISSEDVGGSCGSLQGVVNASLLYFSQQEQFWAMLGSSDVLSGGYLWEFLSGQSVKYAQNVDGGNAEGTLAYWYYLAAGQSTLKGLATVVGIGESLFTDTMCAATGEGAEACHDVVDLLT